MKTAVEEMDCRSSLRAAVIALHAGVPRVLLRPVGESMTPRIRSRQQVLLEPLANASPVNVGDVVLCRAGGKLCLHQVYQVRVKPDGGMRYLIGSARGRINGWTRTENVFGKMTRVL